MPRPRKFSRIQRDEMIALYRSGLTLKAVAERFATSETTVLAALKEVGIARRARYAEQPIPAALAAEHPDADRVDLMVGMYRGGATLQQIGHHFSLTRERVRQLLKRAGIASDTGGSALRPLLRINNVRLQREGQDRRKLAKWGMSLEEYCAHVSEWGNSRSTGAPMRAYVEQRRNAARRDIAWQFTFKEWWGVWCDSGKWAQRGRGYGYAMARIGDSGPYAVGNVEIITGAQNSSDSYLIHPGRERYLKACATIAARQQPAAA